MHDVIIIGAGPAGSTLARLLGKARSVLLVESRNMETGGAAAPSREKCCGGLLAPDARSWLERNGLTLPDSVLDSGQPLAVRAMDLASGLERRYPRAYHNLRRGAFEQWLLSLVPPGVTRCDGRRCVGIAPESGGWRVTLRGPQGVEEQHCRTLVGADGAGSVIRRQLGHAPRQSAMYMAVQDKFALPEAKQAGAVEYAALFHPEVTDFYGWLIPKHNGLLLGAALPLRGEARHKASQAMALLRTRLQAAGYALETPGVRQACLLLRPSWQDVFWGRDSAYCIGEAAGWISPSSAEGFSYAFASAKALAKAILGEKQPERILRSYKRRSLLLLANIAWKQAKSLVMFDPALRRLVMRSRILSSSNE